MAQSCKSDDRRHLSRQHILQLQNRYLTGIRLSLLGVREESSDIFPLELKFIRILTLY